MDKKKLPSKDRLQRSSQTASFSSVSWILRSALLLVSLAIVATIAARTLISTNQPQSVATPSPSVSASTSPTPSNDPYAGWQTYTNPDYGFSFKYPSNWGDVTVQAGEGQTSGKLLAGVFSDNDNLRFGGQTTNYSKPIGSTFLNFAGCSQEANDPDRYACLFAAEKTITITPSLVYRTSDGNLALVLYNTETPMVLDKATRGAYVNMSNASYPGLAFSYAAIPESDFESFDLMIKSVKAL